MDRQHLIQEIRRSMEMFAGKGLTDMDHARMICAVERFVDHEVSAMSTRDILTRFTTARDYTDQFFSYVEREMPGLLCDVSGGSETIISWCSSTRVR